MNMDSIKLIFIVLTIGITVDNVVVGKFILNVCIRHIAQYEKSNNITLFSLTTRFSVYC